ncbi:hypothetical protein HMN09_00048000 [Mycena chlorophos]|uniref:Uncharacterized protein n=1 Tax=Mycena chlorophos TaxID=658473 RepID=A0A8H6TTX8_MYCCL|nr:hypothetical protein HMN09_00048000 [Mycena chlorophos]
MLQLPARKTRSGRDFSEYRLEIFDVDAEELAQQAAIESLSDSEESEGDFESDADANSEIIESVTTTAPAQTTTTGRKRKLSPAPTLSAPTHAPAGPSTAPSQRLVGAAPPPLDLHAPKQDRQRVRRRTRRKTGREEIQASSGSQAKAHCVNRTAKATRLAVELDLDSDTAREPIAASGWVCLNDDIIDRRRDKAAKATDTEATHVPKSWKPQLAEALTLGFSYDDWDGKSQIVYVDRKGRELAVLCGQPRDDNWGVDVAEAGAHLMKELAPQLSPLNPGSTSAAQPQKRKKKKKKKRSVRRGDHRAETIGVGMGNGRTQPGNFRNEDDDAAVLETLLGSKPFTRIAGFCNSMLLNVAPRLHRYYQKTMDALFERYPHLRRIFDRKVSVFPSCTFNFGPQTVTIPHLDLLNLAWGWCFITALGWFDPNKGGHLILWDLKRIVRFPPGSSIAIPSAFVRHLNVAIQEDETRYSFTQFAAGGLFRFVESGFQLNEPARARTARMSVEDRAQWVATEAARFCEGLKMYNVHKQ